MFRLQWTIVVSALFSISPRPRSDGEAAVTFASSALRGLARLSIVASVLAACALAWLYRLAPLHDPMIELTRYMPFLVYLLPALVSC